MPIPIILNPLTLKLLAALLAFLTILSPIRTPSPSHIFNQIDHSTLLPDIQSNTIEDIERNISHFFDFTTGTWKIEHLDYILRKNIEDTSIFIEDKILDKRPRLEDHEDWDSATYSFRNKLYESFCTDDFTENIDPYEDK